ncbi:hypothetical protein BLOT_003109 [Blomia tropicalis]|nr:hypothetical protein BLOT_003109 [Blomia tropicalis]
MSNGECLGAKLTLSPTVMSANQSLIKIKSTTTYTGISINKIKFILNCFSQNLKLKTNTEDFNCNLLKKELLFRLNYNFDNFVFVLEHIYFTWYHKKSPKGHALNSTMIIR